VESREHLRVPTLAGVWGHYSQLMHVILLVEATQTVHLRTDYWVEHTMHVSWHLRLHIAKRSLSQSFAPS
jgi:hypothetical protein